MPPPLARSAAKSSARPEPYPTLNTSTPIASADGEIHVEATHLSRALLQSFAERADGLARAFDRYVAAVNENTLAQNRYTEAVENNTVAQYTVNQQRHDDHLLFVEALNNNTRAVEISVQATALQTDALERLILMASRARRN